jgi:DNA-binding response OmpR family regulator
MALATKRRVVLLADDDVLVRNLIRRSLEAAGFLVLVAADGTEALALSETCPERIDVLLTDVDVAGIDGISLAEQIRLARKDTLVLLMSAGTTHAIPNRMPFISKPFSLTELVAKIEQVLASGRSER